MNTLKKITEPAELLNELLNEEIKNLDLTQIDFREKEFDFSEKQLENIVFSDGKNPNETLIGVKFSSSTLIDCKFEKSTLTNCDFTKARISTKFKKTDEDKVKYASFKDAKIVKTKFRDARINICDFRYADITDSTFQGARFCYTDFYRTAFKGITVFQDAKIKFSSLNYVSFETFCITQDNLKQKNKKNKKQNKTTLVQEDEAIFKDFLSKWDRYDLCGKDMSEKIKTGLNSRYEEAERIYRQFSALWESKGLNRDAEWAYVQARRMERKRLIHEPSTKERKKKISTKSKIALNWIVDKCFGYGVSLAKIFIAYIVLILSFGIAYCFLLEDGFLASMKWSVAHTIGVESLSFKHPKFWVIGLSFLQTGLGMLLTGFLGFVVANRIRKS